MTPFATTKMTTKSIASTYQMRKRRNNAIENKASGSTETSSNWETPKKFDLKSAVYRDGGKRRHSSPRTGIRSRCTPRLLNEQSVHPVSRPFQSQQPSQITWKDNSPDRRYVTESTALEQTSAAKDVPQRVKLLVPVSSENDRLPVSLWTNESQHKQPYVEKIISTSAQAEAIMNQIFFEFENAAGNSTSEDAASPSHRPALSAASAHGQPAAEATEPSTSVNDFQWGEGDTFDDVIIPETQDFASQSIDKADSINVVAAGSTSLLSARKVALPSTDTQSAVTQSASSLAVPKVNLFSCGDIASNGDNFCRGEVKKNYMTTGPSRVPARQVAPRVPVSRSPVREAASSSFVSATDSLGVSGIATVRDNFRQGGEGSSDLRDYHVGILAKVPALTSGWSNDQSARKIDCQSDHPVPKISATSWLQTEHIQVTNPSDGDGLVRSKPGPVTPKKFTFKPIASSGNFLSAPSVISTTTAIPSKVGERQFAFKSTSSPVAASSSSSEKAAKLVLMTALQSTATVDALTNQVNVPTRPPAAKKPSFTTGSADDQAIWGDDDDDVFQLLIGSIDQTQNAGHGTSIGRLSSGPAASGSADSGSCCTPGMAAKSDQVVVSDAEDIWGVNDDDLDSVMLDIRIPATQPLPSSSSATADPSPHLTYGESSTAINFLGAIGCSNANGDTRYQTASFGDKDKVAAGFSGKHAITVDDSVAVDLDMFEPWALDADSPPPVQKRTSKPDSAAASKLAAPLLEIGTSGETGSCSNVCTSEEIERKRRAAMEKRQKTMHASQLSRKF